jgi:hypothetical protein
MNKKYSRGLCPFLANGTFCIGECALFAIETECCSIKNIGDASAIWALLASPKIWKEKKKKTQKRQKRQER